jgi:hypothetical protein
MSTERSPLVSSGISTGSAAESFSRAEPLDGKRPRVRILIFRQRQQRRQRRAVLEPLQRVGDRPPSHARLRRAVEHRGRQLRIRLQPHQRIDAETRGRRRRVAPDIVVVAGGLRERARLHDLASKRPTASAAAAVADEPQRLRRAALHERRRIGQRTRRAVRARSCPPISPSANAEHLPHFGIGVGEHADERLRRLRPARRGRWRARRGGGCAALRRTAGG